MVRYLCSRQWCNSSWFVQHSTRLSLTEQQPAFYVNFKDSILGDMVIERGLSPKKFTHSRFIATPLLPCGKADSKVMKFTGSAEVGEATDDMTKAIHAFAHFSLVFSHEHLVFCDLQGTAHNLCRNLAQPYMRQVPLMQRGSCASSILKSTCES